MDSGELFSRVAKVGARTAGHPAAFMTAFLSVIVWLLTGPAFRYNDTWQLTINTGTTIVTFLIVFLIQNTQNRDIEAIQIKLDELIRATEGAHNALLDLEQLTESELDRIRDRYESLAKSARKGLSQGQADTGKAE